MLPLEENLLKNLNLVFDRNIDDREGGHKEAAPPLDCIQVPPAAPGSD